MNQSGEAIPTTGVSTVKSRTRKSTAESKDTSPPVSTASAKKKASTTKESTTSSKPATTRKKTTPSTTTVPTKTASEAQDPGTTSTTVKRKPGRPKKVTESSNLEPQNTKPLKNSGKNVENTCTESQTEPPKKKRGRPTKQEVFARALALAESIKKRKRQTKEEKKLAGMIALEAFVFPKEPAWPFPSSTRYNSDGTEKKNT